MKWGTLRILSSMTKKIKVIGYLKVKILGRYL